MDIYIYWQRLPMLDILNCSVFPQGGGGDMWCPLNVYFEENRHVVATTKKKSSLPRLTLHTFPVAVKSCCLNCLI